MNRYFVSVVSVVLPGLLLAAAAQAQQQPSICPQLIGDAGLHWESTNAAETQLCRALRADGTEAFGLVISRKPTFEPQRVDRKERGQVDGHEIYWYAAEVAQKPGILARETALTLADGRSAHLWLQAESADQLAAGFQVLQGLHFGAGIGDEQVAGQ